MEFAHSTLLNIHNG